MLVWIENITASGLERGAFIEGSGERAVLGNRELCRLFSLHVDLAGKLRKLLVGGFFFAQVSSRVSEDSPSSRCNFEFSYWCGRSSPIGTRQGHDRRQRGCSESTRSLAARGFTRFSRPCRHDA